MTLPARILRYTPTALLDQDRVVKVSRRERERMENAMLSFRELLGHQPRGRVAIVACGHGAVTRFLESIEVGLHHVTVRAGRRIIAEVRAPLRVNERKASEPHNGTDHDRDRRS